MLIENTEELAQNKLLLLYLVNISDYDLTKNLITEFILENDYMNYFLIQQYLSELLTSRFIKTDNSKDEVFSITETGKVTLSYFADRIPEKFKYQVTNEFTKSEEKLKLEREVLSEFYQKENNQYVVNLKLVEGGDILFSIYLDVPNKKEAERISNLWNTNTENIYQDMLAILMKKAED